MSSVYSEDDTTVVINKKGFILPLTGGTISFISIILGIIIIIISILVFRKKSDNMRSSEVEKNS